MGGRDGRVCRVRTGRARRLTLLVLMAGVVALPAQVQAEGVPWYAHSLKWYEQHTYWRLGGGIAIDNSHSTPARIEDSQGLLSLGVASGPIAGSSAGLNKYNTTIAGELGFIIPYFGEHLSLEVAIAPPLKMDFDAFGTLATQPVAKYALQNQPGTPSGDPIPSGVGAIGTKIGTLHALPPNFTIVYRPWLDTFIRPYVGIGMVWLFTYSPNITAQTLTYKVTPPQLVLTRPIGCVAQAGLDVRLPWHFYLTADARYFSCATVHAELRNITVYSPTLSPTFGPVHVGTISVDDRIGLFLVQLSVGSTFWGN